MSDHTIFGAGTPTLAASGDATPVNLAVGVYQLSGSPWEIRGVRFYVPAGTPGLPSTGYGVYVYGGTVTGGKGVPVSPALAAVFTSDPVLAGQWNELRFATAIPMPSGSYFFPAVWFPAGLYGAATTRFTAGSVQASDGSQLYAAANTEINPGNGLYKYDPAGVMPSVSGNGTWYGIDVIAADINDVSRALTEDVTVGETITAVRTGLPASINIAASATDTLGLVATDTLNATVAGATGSTLIQRSILGERLIWGSIIDQTNKGPLFADDATPLTGSVRFRLQWEAKITGGRIYKAPAFTGDMPVTLWAPDGTKLAETQITGLTADGGGWVDYRFPAAVDGAPGGLYTVSYYSPDGIYAYSPWFWHVQDWVVPPFVVPLFKEAAAARSDGAAFTTAPGNILPTLATATSYYVDVNVEWYVNTPRYNGGREYLQQWTNGQPVASFPVGVFFADPPFLTDYASIGVNTLVAGYTSDEYIAAVKAANMDWYPTVGASAEVIIAATEILDDPVLAARVRGYFLGDEPDMVNDPVYGWRSPQFFKDLRAALRAVDSTRPVMLNLGKWPPLNMTYAWLPPGALPQEVNAHWRDYADAVDLISSDFYNMTSDQNLGVYGIWTYPHITRRMFELSDGRTPVWGYVESTSQVPGEPTPAQVYRASWAHLIAGARGIVFFDHRFADSDVTQDFAALLHNPAMRSQVQALSTQLQALSAPLFAEEAGLATSVTSSGTMAAMLGGYAAGAKIPIHYTTRAAAGTEYLFAQSIRPGSTTGTFTVPTAAGKTITVIGESRTLTANGAGVFTDTFSSDYAVHLYSWTPGTGGGGGGGGGGTLPAGVTLTQIDGGPTYFAAFPHSFPDNPAFFPIGVFNEFNISSKAAAYQNLGINTFVGLYNGPLDGSPADVQVASNLGMYAIFSADLPYVSGGWANTYAAAAGWVFQDEAEGATCDRVYVDYVQAACVDDGNKVDTASFEAMRAAVRGHDSTRPVYNGFTNGFAFDWFLNGTAADLAEFSDIVGYDVYPLVDRRSTYGGQLSIGKPWGTFETVALARQSAAHARPIWPDIETSEVDTFNTTCYRPSGSDVQTLVWNAICAGARGITYFNSNFASNCTSPTMGNGVLLNAAFSDIAAAVQTVNGQIAALAPVINSSFAVGYVTTDAPTKLNVMAKYHASEDAFYVWATPKVNAPGTVTFTLAGSPTTTATVMHEGRTRTVTAGTFTDTFPTANSVHIYKIPNA
jgi:hypothetical protein